MEKLRWDDVKGIAMELLDRHPEINPLNLSYLELRRLIGSLPSFGDEPESASVEQLEAIQIAWYEEIKD